MNDIVNPDSDLYRISLGIAVKEFVIVRFVVAWPVLAEKEFQAADDVGLASVIFADKDEGTAGGDIDSDRARHRPIVRDEYGSKSWQGEGPDQ